MAHHTGYIDRRILVIISHRRLVLILNTEAMLELIPLGSDLTFQPPGGSGLNAVTHLKYFIPTR